MAIDDYGPIIIGTHWFFLWLSGAFLSARLYAKLSRGTRRLWWDDWILIFSWMMLFVEVFVTQLGFQLGFGKHFYDININNVPKIALYTSIGASASCLASWWKYAVWFAVITLFVVMLPSAILTWVQCTPTLRAWNPTVEGHCWNPAILVDYGIFNAAWCATMDFFLAMVPWKLLWGMQMNMREKISVSIAMSLGILAGFCAIVKGVYLVQLSEQDFFYNGKDVVIWTVTETTAAIIGASIPVLRALFKERLSSQDAQSSSKVDFARLTVGGTPKSPNGRVVVEQREKAGSIGWASSITAGEENNSHRSDSRDDQMDSTSEITRINTFVVHRQSTTGISELRRITSPV